MEMLFWGGMRRQNSSFLLPEHLMGPAAPTNGVFAECQALWPCTSHTQLIRTTTLEDTHYCLDFIVKEIKAKKS